MDQIVLDVIIAAQQGDVTRLKALLHPYVHWIENQTVVRGRNNALQRLATKVSPAPPSSYELREGQIYRWVSS